MLRKKSNGYRILLIAEFLCILFLLPGCFQKEQLIDAIIGENISEMAVQVGDHLEYYGARINLLPGVYHVEVKADLSEGQSFFMEMQYDRASFKALRDNAITMSADQDYQEYNFWVLEKVPSAYMQCNFFGVGTEAMVELDIYRTNQGNLMLVFIAIPIFGALNFMIRFRRKILEGKVTKKQQVVFWAMVFGVLLSFFPYMTDYFSRGADWDFHLLRIVGLAKTLKQGVDLPVRVHSYWLYDHGYAVSMFYGDLFLFFPTFLMLIGFSLMAAYKIFIFVILALTAYVAYHSFYRCVKEEYAALFGSLTYLLMPYHIYNVYNRSAVGECLAMIFLPLVCCGMYLLYTEDVASTGYRKHKWYIVWGVSAILQSHMLSSEMTAVFMALTCVVLWRKTFRKQTFLQLLEATVLVVLINAWFWLPLVYMMNADMYHLQRITHLEVQERGILFAGILQLLPNMGGFQTGMLNCEPMQVGAGPLMLLILYGIWRIRRRREVRDREGLFLATLSVLTIVMSTKYPPWDALMKLPVVGYIVSSLQFPTRWMVMSAVFTSMFAAFFFLRINERGNSLLKSALWVATAIGLVSTVYHVNNIAYLSGPIWLYSAENMGTTRVGNGEYLLEEVGEFAYDMYYHDPVPQEGLTWMNYTKKGTNITITLENTSEGERSIEIPLMGYKGYIVNDSEQMDDIPYIAENPGTHGDLRIIVPAGYHGTISISYEGFGFFRVAEVISLISLAVLGGMYIYHKRKKLRNGNECRAK